MRKLFLDVFMLTVADAVCTCAGICTGFVKEANPLLQSFMTANPIATSAAVCLGVGVILWGMYALRNKVRFMLPLILMVLVFKLAVLGLHAVWMFHAFLPIL